MKTRDRRGCSPFPLGKMGSSSRITIGAGVLAFVAAWLVGTAPAASASPGTVYAAPAGTGAACTPGDPCSLGEALSQVQAGGTVALTGPGSESNPATLYIGNWSVSTPGTSQWVPVTIEPAPGVRNPILDGDGSASGTCSTGTCDGAVLTIEGGVYVNLDGVSVQHGDNTSATGGGGAIDNTDGTLNVVEDTFSDNTSANDGGAIDNGDGGKGVLNVIDATFSDNTAANDGGAIDSGDNSGSGTVSVTASVFSDNTATVYDGGAIDSADDSGSGSLDIVGATFSGNVAGFDGGAVDSGDNSGKGTLNIAGTTFSDNQAAVDGGAVDSANYGGTGDLTLVSSSLWDNSAGFAGGAVVNGIDVAGTSTAPGSASTGTATLAYDIFSDNKSIIDGGAVDSGDYAGDGTLSVTASTFTGNTSGASGGAIMSGGPTNTNYTPLPPAGAGDLTVRGSTFSGNTAANDGGAIDSGDFGAGALVVADSTFTTNTATADGGAIDQGDDAGKGTASLVALTLVDNTLTSTLTGDGPTVDNGDHGGTSTLSVAADIFDGSCDQAGGNWADEGYNVGIDSSCFNAGASDVADASLPNQLGPLAYNGGPTQTVALISGPAIGLIPRPTTVTVNGGPTGLCPTVDQRGFPSAFGQPCDSGALQLVVPSHPQFPPPPPYPVKPHGPSSPRPCPASGPRPHWHP